MNDAAFLEAIAAAADDDAPRLIYADWLEERGDPRSRFIRLQCALEHLSPTDPHRFELEDEADDLLTRHGEEWVKPLAGLAHAWRFRRGLVEHVEAPGDVFLQRAGQWFSVFPIRSACLWLPPRLMAVLADCPQLARVEALAFRGNLLRDRELRVLLASIYSGRLAALDLAGQGIEAGGIRALVESPVMPRLHSLDLRMNAAVGDQAARALANASKAGKLRELNLSCTNLTDAGVAQLFGSHALGNLRELDVSARVPGNLRPHFYWIARSPVLPNLASLAIGKRGVGADELRRLREGGKNLRRLDVSGCGLDAAAIEAIAAPQAGRLTGLDVSRNSAGLKGMELLAGSAELASLCELRAAFSSIKDAGAKALAASPHLTRLTVLDLSGNQIGGPGLKALADSPNVSGLRELDLSYNYVGNPGIEALANSSRLSGLRVLKLNANRLTAESAAALTSSPHLSRKLKLEFDSNEPYEASALPLLLDRRA
jgi:uncharacterized protein (TIGR02996 family)